MAFRKIILSCVALCVFPVLAYSMAACQPDLCQQNTIQCDCQVMWCGDAASTPYPCTWNTQTSPASCQPSQACVPSLCTQFGSQETCKAQQCGDNFATSYACTWTVDGCQPEN